MPSQKREVRREIRKVLVANRGEIAVRILRGLRELGIRGVAIYSDADRAGLPVLVADEAYRIGPAPSNESYLKAAEIVDLAVAVGADAIHPGYGFLAENADFARRCEERGVVFIGPPADAIALMGSKIESRRRMIDAGVPVVPGGRDPLADVGAAAAAAEEVGYPVMIKASAGGGGKGMRVVRGAGELPAAFREARSEAAAAFGDDTVYIEKLVLEPRHVEIQVLGDHHGTMVSLGERECSLQRRNQKVVEEAPSPVVDPELRRRMGDAAVRAARAAGYVNAGTVEFLLDRGGDFYFLEMNTRLQVEHPVTELVTGLDLVAAQLHIAGGGKLGPEFDDVTPRGHSIEVRLYAEDPFRGFAPSPGRLLVLRMPEGPGVRNDSGVYEGAEIPIYYDPLIAKLIVWASDRPTAIARLERALGELRVEGIRTNAPLFRQILRDEDFRAGRLDIGMLDRKLADGTWAAPAAAPAEAPAAAPAEAPAATEPAAPQADLPLIAAAIAHAERQRIAAAGTTLAAGTPAAGTPAGHRGNWHLAARREALGNRAWS